jgi:hypothetical protein
MKKIKGDKLIGVIIHTHMEVAQGNSLCGLLYLKQAKMSCLSFCLFFFSSTKSENGKEEQILPRGRAGASGRGEVMEKGGR